MKTRRLMAIMKKDDFNPFMLMHAVAEDPKLFETRIVFSKERNRYETEMLKKVLDENQAPHGD